MPTQPSCSDPVETVIDTIFDLFRTRGHLLYGEQVTERMHALQCAQLAETDNAPDTLIVSALLHDIGHLLHQLGEDIASRGVDAHHEDHGEQWLRSWFPPEVTEPVRLHVEAKRYLCGVDPMYLAALSEASARSLSLQGGPMSAQELANFRAGPFADAALRLRRYDDAGKDPQLPEIDIEHFRPALRRVLGPALSTRPPVVVATPCPTAREI